MHAIINASLPQSQWQPRGYPFHSVTNNTRDPDTNPEPLAIATEAWVPNPLITSHTNAAGGFRVSFDAVPGYDYTVQSATNLTSPVQWAGVGTVSGTNFVAPVSVTDTNPANQSFYRLARSPSP